MDFKIRNVTSRNKGFIISTLFLISVFLGITLFGIYQSKNLAEKTESFYNSPFVVTYSLQKIRSYIVDLNEKLNVWQDETTLKNTEIALKHLENNNQNTVEYIAQIKERYLGPKQDILDLIDSKDQLNLYYQKLSTDTNKRNYFSKNIESLFLIINEYKTRLDKVEKFALNKAEELSVEAEELKEKTQNRFVLAFIVGLFFIILSSVLVIRNNIITEKKILKNQQDLAKSEKLFRSLFENAPVGISMTGLDGSLKLNSSFCNILGYEEEELLAKSWKEITHKDDISESETIVKDLLNGKSDEAIFEKRYLHKSGEIVWTSVATHLLRDQLNKPLFFITFIIDKSDEKIYQNQLLDLNNKLKESNKELEEFAYVASHDLQEPLRTVNSFIQLFEKEVAETLNERTGKFLYFIKDGSHRMQTMINDLLTYSRVNSNKDANETVDLNELLKSVNHVLSEKIATKNAVIKVEELPKIKFVPSLIERVFRNLIENGIKYNTSKKPEISASFITKNKFHEFAISDNGIGIDKKDTDKIFVIFKRLHAKSEYSGTGIGLSVCKRIINKNGGEIWVESEPGKGSTFKFTIPT